MAQMQISGRVIIQTGLLRWVQEVPGCWTWDTGSHTVD